MKNTLSLMTVCGMLLASVAWGQVAPAGNSQTSPADSGNVTAGPTASASQSASNAPVITRVSPILPRRTQTIVIEGSGFGNSPPKLVSVGDAVDTDARNGQRPTLVIRSRGSGPDNWDAGLFSDGGPDAIGVKLVSWTDTKITLAGFGDALGDEQNGGNWKIAAGDPIEFRVFGPAGSAPAKLAMTVSPLPAEDKTSVTEAQASGESEKARTQILFNQWAASLPALVVWTVGLVLVMKRWRERPQISKLVAIACGVALLTLIFMPVVMQIGNQIKFAFVPPLLTLVRACLGALSIGLLLKAVFVEHGKSDLPAPEESSRQSQAVIGGPMGTAPGILPGTTANLDKIIMAINNGWSGKALKVAAKSARWIWRGCSIVIFLFAAPFLLAGIPAGIKALWESSIWNLEMLGAVLMFTVIGVFLAGLVVAWRREGLGALVIGPAVGVPFVIGLIKGQHDDELIVYVVWALTLLVTLSWALNTLAEASAKPDSRRAAILLAPLLIIGIGFCIYCMPGSKFNP